MASPFEHTGSDFVDQLRARFAAPEPLPSQTDRGDAAVAAVLRGEAIDELELLLIRRADREGDVWSGHLALPGGRWETTDATLVHTAQRETMEELGLDLGPAAAIGALPALRPRLVRAPRLDVHPFVWLLTRPVGALQPNEEVAEYRWIGIDHLVQLDNAVDHVLLDPAGVERSFPGIQVGEHVLWGITHRIVETLLERLGMAVQNDST